MHIQQRLIEVGTSIELVKHYITYISSGSLGTRRKQKYWRRGGWDSFSFSQLITPFLGHLGCFSLERLAATRAMYPPRQMSVVICQPVKVTVRVEIFRQNLWDPSQGVSCHNRRQTLFEQCFHL